MNNVEYICRGKYESRILQIAIGDKKFTTPTYFPSVSSSATRMQFDALVQFCISKRYPRLLISAYDLHDVQRGRQSIISALKKYTKNNFLFVDSGTFESYWLKKKWNYIMYRKIIKEFSGDFYASFDEIPNPDDNIKNIISTVNTYTKKSVNISKDSQCVTVVHGNTPSQLVKVIEYISKNNTKYLSMVAIPEKDCGKTLQDKITTVQNVRRIMSKENPTSILHVLGCGNPLSMAIFAFAGADSFDSTDWSRWIVNPKTLQLMDYSHIDLANCPCQICKRKNLDSTNKGLLHNLLFYQEFTQKLQTIIIQNKGLDFLKQHVDRKTFSKIVKFF